MSGYKDRLLLNAGGGEQLLESREAPERSVTWRLLTCAFVGSVCAAQYGWAIGIINFPAAVMCSDFELSGTDSWWWSGGVVAGFCVAGFLGSHFGGGLADAMGRRRLVVALNVPFVAAGLLGYGASVLKGQGGLWLMLASRLVVGAAAGAGSVVTPLYLGEIATEATRGAFGALFQLQITVFILLVQLASMPGALSSSSTWGYLFAASAALSLAGLLAAPLLIESPKWLLKQGRQDHAQSALALLRGVSQAEALEDLQHLEGQEEGGGGEDVEARLVGGAPAQPRVLSLGQVLADAYLRFPLLILSVLMVTQQFSGINAVFYYSAGFFKDAGVDATTGTIAAGAVNLLATAVSVPLIERLGRRPLILTGIAGMGLCTCGIVAALLLKPSHPALTVTLGYTAIVFVMGAVAFFEVGLGAIPWSIGGELFPADSKGAAMSFGAVLSWTGATLVGLLFPLMQKALPNGLSFAPFAACLCAAFVFALRYVPETKGKSAAQLLAEINGAEKVAA